jgi:outer membrane protein assembly factor BamA
MLHNPLSLLTTLAMLIAIAPTLAEEEPPGAEESKPQKWVAAPLVSSSPGFGTGGGAMVMRFYNPNKKDSLSPPSSLNAVGLYSDTDSYFTGLFNQSYLREDTWRLNLGGVHGKVNSELDIEGLGQVDFATTFAGVFLKSEWRTVGDIFLGFTLSYVATRYKEGNELSSDYFDLYNVEDSENGSGGVSASYDTRDNIMFPYSGALASAKLNYYPESWGAVEDYMVLELDGNLYHEVLPRQILALRGYGRTVSEGAPFSALSTLGQRGDMRGYTPGERVAENLISAQTEYRCMFARKWGVVGFVGVAALYDDSVVDVTSNEIFASGGIGMRYVLHEEHRLNFRIDYAWGEGDEEGLYVGVREAF